MREAVFGLARIEEELISESRRSFIRQVLERAMMEHADEWKPYYHGNEVELRMRGLIVTVTGSGITGQTPRFPWPSRD